MQDHLAKSHIFNINLLFSCSFCWACRRQWRKRPPFSQPRLVAVATAQYLPPPTGADVAAVVGQPLSPTSHTHLDDILPDGPEARSIWMANRTNIHGKTILDLHFVPDIHTDMCGRDTSPPGDTSLAFTFVRLVDPRMVDSGTRSNRRGPRSHLLHRRLVPGCVCALPAIETPVALIGKALVPQAR